MKTFFKLSAAALFSSSLLLAYMVPANAAPKGNATQPANAGQNGTKSNAGGGNGTEAGALLGTSVTTTIISAGDPVSVPVDGSTTSVAVPLPPTTVSTTSTPTGVPHHANGKPPAGNNSAVVQDYSVTTTTTTWSGSQWIETTETVILQDVVKQDLTTNTFEDLDPGNSADHNQSPEGDTAVETSAVQYDDTLNLGPGEDIVEVVGEFEASTSSTVVTEQQLVDPNCQGSSC